MVTGRSLGQRAVGQGAALILASGFWYMICILKNAEEGRFRHDHPRKSKQTEVRHAAKQQEVRAVPCNTNAFAAKPPGGRETRNKTAIHMVSAGLA